MADNKDAVNIGVLDAVCGSRELGGMMLYSMAEDRQAQHDKF